MKLFASGVVLIFAAVLAMSLALHCVSAIEDDTLEDLPREDQNSFGDVENDEKQPQPLRERRSVKSNDTQGILKRLHDMEIKYVTIHFNLICRLWFKINTQRNSEKINTFPPKKTYFSVIKLNWDTSDWAKWTETISSRKIILTITWKTASWR